MCGLFGFISTADRRADPTAIMEIAEATQSRGQHAFGLAWIDGQNRLKRFTQTGPIVDHLGIVRMAASEARVLIGHCRYATAGLPADRINNHPHPADGGWIMHNGCIPAPDRIIRHYGLIPSSQCDSELLGLLIERMSGPLIERTVKAATICAGAPLAMLGLWSRPARLIAVRMGQPLHAAPTIDGVYLASLAAGMPGTPKLLPDDRALYWDGRKITTRKTRRKTARLGF